MFPSIVSHGPDAAWFEAFEGDERDFIFRAAFSICLNRTLRSCICTSTPG